jgi:hypothetical protein
MNRGPDRARPGAPPAHEGFARAKRLRWWYLAEAMCASLTVPKRDIAAADRDVEALLRASWLWRCGELSGARIGAAWRDSMCRRLVHSIVGTRVEPLTRD